MTNSEKWRRECYIICDKCGHEQETDLESLRSGEGVAGWLRQHGWVQYLCDSGEYGYFCPICAGKMSAVELKQLDEAVRTALGWGSKA